MYTIGYASNSSILGIPIFFILFFLTLIIWLLDYKNIKKYYDKSLSYFIFLGAIYIISSFFGIFSILFDIPMDRSFIFRQSYFIPYLAIGIPVFTESFNYGLFKYLINNLKVFFVFSLFFFNAGIVYSVILLISILSKGLAFILFIITVLYTYLSPNLITISLQVLIIQLVVLVYFLININFNIRFLGFVILILVLGGYAIQDSLVTLITILDSHAGFRLHLWVDNIRSTIDNTFFLGHGFGTSYFFAEGREPGDFILQGLSQRSNYAAETLRSYSLYQSEFVLGQHNSIVNIFYRLGLFGLILFLNILISTIKQLNKYGPTKEAKYISLICIIIIAVNVGLESPGYATEFIFLIGMIRFQTYQYFLDYFENISIK